MGGKCGRYTGEEKYSRGFCGEAWRKEGDDLQDLCVGGRRILQCILMKQDGRVRTGSIGIRIRKSVTYFVYKVINIRVI